MVFKTTHDPDVLEEKSGGGCLALFGLPFFLVGLAVMFSPFVAKAGKAPPWFIAVGFGGVFAAVGLAFIGGRSGVRLDARRRTVRRWWSCLCVGGSKEIEVLDTFRVRMSREVRRSKNSTYTVYPVRLVGGEKDVDLETCGVPGKARATAEQVCKLLGLDMEDTTSGAAVIRERDTLDDSLRDRARRTGATIEVSDMPPGSGIRLQQEGGDLVIELPRPGVRATHKLALGGILVLSLILGLAFLSIARDPKTPSEVRIVMICILGAVLLLPITAGLAYVLKKAKSHATIRVSKDRLCVESCGVFGSRVAEIPADELEELVLPESVEGEIERKLDSGEIPEQARKLVMLFAGFKAQPIRAVSDNATIEFGRDISYEERVWLHSLIMRVMTA